MAKCGRCKERDVLIRKWGLCGRCYQLARHHNEIDTTPATTAETRKYRIQTRIEKEIRFKNNLIKRHGESILDDFDRLHTQPFWNLTDLGKKYGFTRERARQLFVRLYGVPYGPVRILKNAKVNEESDSLQNGCDPRAIIANSTEISPVIWGSIGEYAVMEKAEQLGFKVQCTKTKAYDLSINGIPVEVKYCGEVCRTSPGGPLYWKFQFRNDPKNSVFTAVYIGPGKKYFIFPSRLLEKGKCYYIPSDYGWFKEYEDRWDLLEPRTFVDLCSDAA